MEVIQAGNNSPAVSHTISRCKEPFLRSAPAGILSGVFLERRMFLHELPMNPTAKQ